MPARTRPSLQWPVPSLNLTTIRTHEMPRPDRPVSVLDAAMPRQSPSRPQDNRRHRRHVLPSPSCRTACRTRRSRRWRSAGPQTAGHRDPRLAMLRFDAHLFLAFGTAPVGQAWQERPPMDRESPRVGTATRPSLRQSKVVLLERLPVVLFRSGLGLVARPPTFQDLTPNQLRRQSPGASLHALRTSGHRPPLRWSPISCSAVMRSTTYCSSSWCPYHCSPLPVSGAGLPPWRFDGIEDQTAVGAKHKKYRDGSESRTRLSTRTIHRRTP